MHNFYNRYGLRSFFVVSVILSLALLWRWPLTENGIYNFGRVWHFYLNWFDVGFSRRSLFGTVLLPFTSILSALNVYTVAYIIQSVLIIIFNIMLYVLFSKRVKYGNSDLAILLFFSPALSLHFAYATGNLDIVVVILCLSFLMVRSLSIKTVIIVGSIFVHEITLFLLPSLLWTELILRRMLSLKSTMLITFFSFLAFLVTLYFEPAVCSDQRSFELLMFSYIPSAIQHPNIGSLWSGYFEVCSSAAQNLDTNAHYVKKFLSEKISVLLIILNFVNLVVIFFCTTGTPRSLKFSGVCFTMFPLFIVLLGADIFRWVAFSHFLLLINIYFNSQMCGFNSNRFYKWIVLSYVALGPLGAAQYERAYPIFQVLF